ncbi:hypothetical protein [Nostoc sp. NMS7]|nr:hypothetical protein [Nostoc sp. NMS7]
MSDLIVIGFNDEFEVANSIRPILFKHPLSEINLMARNNEL